MERSLTRREALAAAGTAAAGVALAPYLRVAAAPAQAKTFAYPLRRMPIIRRADIKIPIVQADVPLVRGERTLMWTFDGTFPGPTIRRAAGRTTRVTFDHRIPEAGSLTIHNHGHHSAAKHDGQPMSELIEPGGSREYVYEHVENGEPLRGAMRWYHDHSHGRTNRNSWMGLLGLFIVVDPLEKQLKLPGGDQELLLVLTTRTLDANNQLVDPFTGNTNPGADIVGSGTLMLVNGVSRPYAVVEPTTYRLRILNAASFNPYNIGFEKGPEILQIGNESGLFPAPAKRERVLMGPAERCDLFVDFSRHAGKEVVLSSAPQEATAPLASLFPPAVAPEEELMQFRVRKRKRKKTPAARPAPKKLVALPKWTQSLVNSPDRVFVLGQAIDPAGGATVWTINGAPYDPAQVVARPELGSTETWLLVNATQQSHYMHLHAVDWKVVSRNGGTPAADEDVLKETFRLDPGETLAVGAQLHRPRGSLPNPLPHAQPRGPRDDDHVRDRPAGRRGPRRTPVGRRRRSSRSRRARARPARHADRSRARAHAVDARRAGADAGPASPAAQRSARIGVERRGVSLPPAEQGGGGMSSISRRGFLAGGAGAAAASLVPLRGAPPAEGAGPVLRTSLFPPERIGIQLYSVADQVSSVGFAKVLEEVAAIGYKLVEFAGYTQGTGPISTKQLRELLDANGLKAIGSHVSPSSDDSMKQILEDAAVLGIPNVGISLPLPSEGPTASGWTALSQEYNRYGEMAAAQGIGFYLHNHFHEWFPTPDDPTKRGEDVLLAETDPRYVFFEMDVYWAYVGQWQSGQILQFDPLTDYAIPNRERYRLFHVKDGKKDVLGGYTDAALNIVDAGQGSIDFQDFFNKLFAQSPDEVDKHWYIWERDNADMHPRGSLAAARASFTYIRHGLIGKPAAAGAGVVVAGVVAAVTDVAFKRVRSRRVVRVTIEADDAIEVTLDLRRGSRSLARKRKTALAAGRHKLDLPLPQKVAAGRARLDVTLGARTTHLAVQVPTRRS